MPQSILLAAPSGACDASFLCTLSQKIALRNLASTLSNRNRFANFSPLYPELHFKRLYVTIFTTPQRGSCYRAYQPPKLPVFIV